MMLSNQVVDEVLAQVKTWPVETRLKLARRVLETLEIESTTIVEAMKGPSAQQVLGLWNPAGVAPTDEECDRMLADELLQKHSA